MRRAPAGDLVPPCWAVRWALLTASLLTLAACGPAAVRPLNVYLVTLDTTRADHLGCYGYRDIETPIMDRLAAEGVLYEKALAPAPITLPAHASILTGTYPIFHGVRDNNGFYVADESITLAEVLGENGYETAAFVGSFPLDSQTNINQGFDLYDDNYPSAAERGRHPAMGRFYDERPASEVGRVAMGWLKERDPERPFFMWNHFWDPHQPQSPPEPYRSRYRDRLYDGEIAFVDEVLGQVLGLLEQLGELDNTLIVLTADHGEGLGEHGEMTHALLTHSATVRIPLIVRDPRNLTPRRIDTPVSTVDILPTILHRLGIDPPSACQGHPLPATRDEGSDHKLIFSESAYGTVNYGWSLVERLTVGDWVFMGAPTPRLYNHTEDPTEDVDLADAETHRAAELAALLDERREELAVNALDTKREIVAPEVSARLAALGYMGTADSMVDPRSLRVDPELADPWDMMEVADLMNEANNLLDAKQVPVAIALYKRAREQDPGNAELPRRLVIAYLQTGDFDSAKEELDKLLVMAPDSVGTQVALSDYYRRSGQSQFAVEPLKRAIELDPNNLATYQVLAWLQDQLGQSEAAIGTYREILERSQEDTSALNALAVNLYRAGEVEEPIALLERALDSQPFYPPGYLNLAVIEHDRGEHEASLRLAERALKLRPRYLRALELKAMNLEALEDASAAAAWRQVFDEARDDETRDRSTAALERLGETPPA